MASSSVCKNKISNIFFVHYKTSQHGAWLMPTELHGVRLMFKPEKIRADCSSCSVRGRTAQPQTNITKATGECPQLGLSGTREQRVSVALRAPVCLTPYRRAPHRCRPNHAVTFGSAGRPSKEQCSVVCGQIALSISS